MVGIISGLFGEPKKDDIPNAPELINTGDAEVEKEIEYCFFLELNDSSADTLAKVVEGADKQYIIEGKLGKGTEVRIRKKLNANFTFDKCEIQTKYREGEDAVEIENELAEATFDRLLPISTLGNARVRFELPYPNTVYEWEIDAFMLPTEKEAKFSRWIKIELEVKEKHWSDDEVIKNIPFDYLKLIPGNTKEPEDREMIDRLWQIDYNYLHKDPFIR